jgi:hypothetical protein
MADLMKVRKAGKVANGAGRGKGTIWHVAPRGYGDAQKALCGALPRIAWVEGHDAPTVENVTCPRCRAALSY